MKVQKLKQDQKRTNKGKGLNLILYTQSGNTVVSLTVSVIRQVV